MEVKMRKLVELKMEIPVDVQNAEDSEKCEDTDITTM